MDNALAYSLAIIFLVISVNFYLLVYRRMRGPRPRKPNRIAPSEARQAAWRDKEVQRRIDREQDDAYHRVQLRNETLALYDEVRRRAAAREKEEINKDKNKDNINNTSQNEENPN